MKKLFTGLVLSWAALSLVVCATPYAVADTEITNQLTGASQIQADLQADAPSGFSNLLNRRTWRVSYNSSERISLGITPSGLFSVAAARGESNVFLVTLINSRGLLASDGDLMPLRFWALGQASGVIQASSEIGMTFNRSNGEAIDLNALRRNSSVRNFQLNVNPSNIAELVRIDGTVVSYRRTDGNGMAPATVTLSYDVDGIHRVYTGALPTRDDGSYWAEVPMNYTSEEYFRTEYSYGATREEASSRQLSLADSAGRAACAAAAQVLRNDREVIRVVRFQYIDNTASRDISCSFYSSRDPDRNYTCFTTTPRANCSFSIITRQRLQR